MSKGRSWERRGKEETNLPVEISSVCLDPTREAGKNQIRFEEKGKHRERKRLAESSSHVLPHCRDPDGAENVGSRSQRRRDRRRGVESAAMVGQKGRTSRMQHPCSLLQLGYSAARRDKVSVSVGREREERKESRTRTNFELLFRKDPLQLQDPSFPDLLSI